MSPSHAVARREGMVLLEVIIAMTITAVAGLSSVTWARQTVDAVTHARESANTVRKAAEYLDHISLWPRIDLDRHLGARRAGPWTVTVGRPTATLYIVVIADSTANVVLLRTVLYRPDTARVAP